MQEKMKVYKGRPESCEGRLEKEIRSYDLLDSLGIEYDRIDHEAAATIEACKEAEALLGAEICKNLFLTPANKSKFFLYLVTGDKKFRTGPVSRQVGSSRLSFASEDYLDELLGLTPGSVTVLGLMNDSENRVGLLIDEDVLKLEYIGFHPCINTSTLKIKTKDITEKLLPALHHSFTIIKNEV